MWSFTVPSTGTYQVYARWVAASSHASNAPFTIKHSGGSQTVSVSQRSSNGVWVLLGSYTFASGTAGSVTLTDKANGTVVADAIKLVATTGGATTEAVRYLHGDHLNTPRLATNQQGQKVWSWEGEACGATAPTGSVTINLRFPGQYYDAESGLHYNWNRYYDPKLCRYLTVDPISVGKHAQMWMTGLGSGLNGEVLARASDALIQMGFDFGVVNKILTERPQLGLNPYTYVLNNPLRWTDPTGLLNPGEDDGGGGQGAGECPLIIDWLMFVLPKPVPIGVLFCVYDCNKACPRTLDNIVVKIQYDLPPFRCHPFLHRPRS